MLFCRLETVAHELLRFIYTAMFYLAIPFVLLRLLWRARLEPAYVETLGQRFGFCDAMTDAPVWVHAVSAGETNAAAPLIERLLASGNRVLVTTMTPTGRARVKALFGDRVSHTYAPYDIPGAVRRFLASVKPKALVIIDTEMWPNMLMIAHEQKVKTLLVNARLSESSASGYRFIGPITRQMLDAIDLVATQTRAHGDRFLSLGLAEDKLVVAGSVKFDMHVPADLTARAEELTKKIGQRRVVLGASTHAGEEEAMLDAVLPLNDPDVLLILAPRHSHRTDDIVSLCKRKGIDPVRHSGGQACDASTRVMLLDTMGELLYFYKVSEIAFVGGSLTDVGGHNPMEPAGLGIPTIMGPHLENIEDIAGQFVSEGGMLVVANAGELTRAIARLLNDAAERESLVAAAARVMAANSGALDRVEKLVMKLTESSY